MARVKNPAKAFARLPKGEQAKERALFEADMKDSLFKELVDEVDGTPREQDKP